MKKILGFILVLAVVGSIWYMATKKADAPVSPVAGEETTTETPDVTPVVSSDVLSGSVSITIKNYKYAPATIKVKKGTKITWTNEDVAGHTVTADNGSWESKLLAKGGTYEKTFDSVGTFAYHCAPHPYMKASIEVVE